MLGQQLKQLLDLLDLEMLDEDLFRGVSPRSGRDRIFGGQVMAQALIAATRTVEGRLAHSFHCYFLRPGDPERPILFQVERTRDGRSFSSRRVTARQRGEVLLDFSASFHAAEPGLAHQIETAVPELDRGPQYEDEIRAEVERRGGPVERDDRRFDHAMWFHAPLRADEWLYYEQESPVTAAARGFATGRFFTEKGRLVASCVQEGLIRYRPPGSDG